MIFLKTIDEYNFNYFMDPGTLFGSYRHHGIIPWNNDTDIYADVKQCKQVRAAIHTINKDKYIVTVHTKGLLKLHARKDSNTILYKS